MDYGVVRGSMAFCWFALGRKDGGPRKLSNLARPSKVQIAVSMVCKLVEMHGVVLTTVSGVLRRTSMEDPLDSPSQWRQMGVGGLPKSVRRRCRRLGDTDTSLGLDDIGR